MKYEISTRTEMLVQIFVKNKNKKTIKREREQKEKYWKVPEIREIFEKSQ